MDRHGQGRPSPSPSVRSVGGGARSRDGRRGRRLGRRGLGRQRGHRLAPPPDYRSYPGLAHLDRPDARAAGCPQRGPPSSAGPTPYPASGNDFRYHQPVESDPGYGAFAGPNGRGRHPVAGCGSGQHLPLGPSPTRISRPAGLGRQGWRVATAGRSGRGRAGDPVGPAAPRRRCHGSRPDRPPGRYPNGLLHPEAALRPVARPVRGVLRRVRVDQQAFWHVHSRRRGGPQRTGLPRRRGLGKRPRPPATRPAALDQSPTHRRRRPTGPPDRRKSLDRPPCGRWFTAWPARNWPC